MPKLTGEDPRCLVESNQVIELAFRDAYLRYPQMHEDIAPASVVRNARRAGVPFVAVVLDGDVLIGPEKVGEQHAVSRKPLNVRRKVDARVELRMGDSVAAHAVGKAKMQHELGFSRGSRSRENVWYKPTGELGAVQTCHAVEHLVDSQGRGQGIGIVDANAICSSECECDSKELDFAERLGGLDECELGRADEDPRCCKMEIRRSELKSGRMNRDIVRVPCCLVCLGEKMNLLALPLFGKDAHSCSYLGFSKRDAKLGSEGRWEGVNTGAPNLREPVVKSRYVANDNVHAAIVAGCIPRWIVNR